MYYVSRYVCISTACTYKNRSCVQFLLGQPVFHLTALGLEKSMHELNKHTHALLLALVSITNTSLCITGKEAACNR